MDGFSSNPPLPPVIPAARGIHIPFHLPPVILAAAGIQSPSPAPARVWQRRNAGCGQAALPSRATMKTGHFHTHRWPSIQPPLPLPSFSPQRESRALPLRRHAYGNVETLGVGKPLSPVALLRKQIIFIPQGGTHRRPSIQPPLPLPSFSPQRESRALPLRRHAYRNVETPGVGKPFSPRRACRITMPRTRSLPKWQRGIWNPAAAGKTGEGPANSAAPTLQSNRRP